MKKKLAVSFLITLILVFNVACSADDNGANTEGSTRPLEQVEKDDPETNAPLEQVEKEERETIDGIKQYGQLVNVKGKKMNVLVAGEGKETVVLLPGYGDLAPGLSYTKLIEELSENYRVAVVEPFGYGLSDVTDDPRTMDHITEEIHEALQQLGIEKYHLMGYATSGVYAMQYVNQYEDEVTSFIGLDTDTPKMNDDVTIHTGEMDAISGVSGIPGVSEEINEQYGLIAKKVSGNKNLTDEAERKNENYNEAKQFAFPKDLPVAFFLGRDTIENRKFFPSAEKDWVKMHAELIKGSNYKEVYIVETNQLIYATKYTEITETLRTFLENMPAKN